MIDIPGSLLGSSLLAIVVISVLCFRHRKRAPFLIVGWLFFLGTLVPMIGLVQVGWQSIADRYMYLPMIGPIIMVAWSADVCFEKFATSQLSKWVAGTLATTIVVLLAITTIHQLQYWHDTRTLFGHALDLNPQNAIAHLQLGYLDVRLGHIEDAKKHYERAIQIDPTYFVTEYDLANLLLHNNQPGPAAEHYEKAAADAPGVARIENNWGIALLQLQRKADAFEHFRAAEKQDPSLPDAHLNLAQLFLSAGRLDSAESEFNAALALVPGDPAALRGLQALHAARESRPRK